MSYPPPPGLGTSKNPNLPARPPPSTAGPHPPSFNKNVAAKPSFAFAPRAVASTASTSAPARTASPAHFFPQSPYSPAAAYAASGRDGYQSTQQQQPASGYEYAQYGAPHIRNPFVPTSSANSSSPYAAQSGYDPEYEAQLAQWQSAYTANDKSTPGQISKSASASAGPVSRSDTPTTAAAAAASTTGTSTTEKQMTVKRVGGGTEWSDSSLLEWDPAHFRLFIGNLAGETTDDSLLKAFAQYPSVQKARVIRDKRTTKSKGYGFVSFSDGDDYFRAAKEMNGKYIGSHPVTITKAKTEVRPSVVRDKHHKHKGKGGPLGKVDHGGIDKKQPKTKGGLKLLG